MKSIIVGTDFSQGSFVALDLAAELANCLRCGIKLVWVKREKKLIDEQQQQVMCRLAKEKLQRLCDEHGPRLRHGTIVWEVMEGKVAASIARAVQHENAPMVVIGTNGASGFEKYWMGSTAVRIVQESPVPVLTVREGFDFRRRLECIVVPIRVNVNSRQKVPPAAAIAKVFGAQIHILGLSALPEQQSQLNAYVNQAADYLRGEGVASTTAIRPYDNYCDTVLAYADEVNADLVVINTEQDKVLAQIFLGTNAQQVVHRAQIPVLCIHPADIFYFSKT